LPEIGRIQSTNFQALLTELGITRNNIPFALRSEVTPVVLVGGTVSFVAAPTPAYGITDVFTAGLLTNPAASTNLADTGPLQAGAYSVLLFVYQEVVGTQIQLEWRNAGNTANLLRQRFAVDLSVQTLALRLNVENDNERFRLVNVAAPGAGVDMQGTIMAKT